MPRAKRWSEIVLRPKMIISGPLPANVPECMAYREFFKPTIPKDHGFGIVASVQGEVATVQYGMYEVEYRLSTILNGDYKVYEFSNSSKVNFMFCVPRDRIAQFHNFHFNGRNLQCHLLILRLPRLRLRLLLLLRLRLHLRLLSDGIQILQIPGPSGCQYGNGRQAEKVASRYRCRYIVVAKHTLLAGTRVTINYGL